MSPDAAYYREWRRAHPEYRARERERARRRTDAAYVERNSRYSRRSRALPPYEPPRLHGHPIFDEAVRIVGQRRTSLTTLSDPLYDDLICVAMLAICEGEDAAEAVRAYRARELRWGRVTAPIIAEVAA